MVEWSNSKIAFNGKLLIEPRHASHGLLMLQVIATIIPYGICIMYQDYVLNFMGMPKWYFFPYYFKSSLYSQVCTVPTL